MAENKWSILEAVNESNNLRAGGDEFGYYYKDGMMHIGDPLVFNQPDYSQLNEDIVRQGEKNTAELKELLGKASEIKAHPQGYLPGNIPFPTKYQMSNFVTSALNNLGVPMEGSMFVSELLTDVNQKGFGILHATGLGELAEVAEGFPKFQAGLSQKDTGVATEGLLQTVFGGVGAYPFVKDFLKQLTPKAKEGLSWMAGKAREYKANQAPGTKLLSTDPTDPTVDAIIKLDEMVNKPQGPELTGSSGELGFYSKALEETKKLQQKKGSGQQFRQMLKKAGVSDDEIEWSGLNEVLNKDKTTKKEIEDQLRLNKLEIREVVKDKMPEEARMNWDIEFFPNLIGFVKSADELKEGELPGSQSAKINPKNLMTPEEVFGPYYIDERADEIANETMLREGKEMDIELARAEALREFYDDPYIRIEDKNTGMVILGNDSTGYSIYPDMQSTKGEGAFKNAYTYSPPQNRSQSQEIYSLAEAKVEAQQIAQDEGLMSFGDEGMVMFSDDSNRLGGGENYREFVITSNKYDENQGPPFEGGHFDEENIIGHFRTSDRTTADGNRVLYIDEIQSDWGQKGREKGFKKSEEEMQVISQKRKEAQALVDKYTEQVKKTGKDLEGKELDEANEASNYLSETQEFVLANDRKVLKGPFVENTSKWTDLMVKRILAKAVEEGYDMVSFSPGYIQNMRWGKKGLLKYYDDILVKRVTKIVDKLDDTAFGLGNEKKGAEGFGRVHLQDDDITELAEEAYNETQEFDFTRDQILEPFAVRITDKLKEAVKKGQSLFALPVVAGATAMTMEGDDVR